MRGKTKALATSSGSPMRPERNGGDDGLDDLFGKVGDHIGLGHAGRDSVDANAHWGELTRDD